MKSHICWTTREWELIAERLVTMGITQERHGWRGELVSAMKMVLPKDRWRNPTNLNTAKKTLRPLMAQLMMCPSSNEQVEVQPTYSSERLSTEDLLVELARRIAKMLEPSKSQAEVLAQLGHLERKFEESRIIDHGFHKCSTEKHSERTHKPRILVCGPNGDTSRALTAEFPNLDLRFVGYEENSRQVGARSQGCSSILCITKFMQHSTVDAVKATGKLYTLVTTVLEAREWLRAHTN